MPNSSSTLDLNRFHALGALQEEGQPDVLAEMVGLFVGETEAWLVDARHAADSGDVVGLRRVAHSLKGACSTIGADRMCRQAALLEEALMAGRLLEAVSTVDALTQEFGRVRTLLVPYAPDARSENRTQTTKSS